MNARTLVRFVPAATVCLLLTGAAQATVRTVPGNFSTIQSALWACVQGDTVLVSPGSYFEPITWPALRTVKLFAVGDTSNTSIDGLETFRPLLFDGVGTDPDSTTIIRGFNITWGAGVVNGGGLLVQGGAAPLFEDCAFTFNNCADTGGAVRCETLSAPMFRRCDFRDNSADFGGGVGHNNSSPVFEDCRFLRNTSNRSGGATNNFNLTNARYTGCRFEDNHAYTTEGTAASGGAVRTANSSVVTLQDCEFVGNTAQFTLPEGEDGYGGAISNNTSSTLIVSGCRFESNETGILGGGIFSYEASMTLENCVFIGNHAGRGGGVFLNTAPPTIIRDCVFQQNDAVYGAGLAGNADSLEVYNCWFTGNTAQDWAAIDCGFETRFHSCVITGNVASGDATGGHSSIIGFYSGRMELHNCTIAGNMTTVVADTTNSVIHYEGELVAGDALGIYNTIVAGNTAQMIYDCRGLSDLFVECSLIHDATVPPWGGCLGPYDGINGNLNADPQFANAGGGDYSPAEGSPCLPANNSCNELIGALDVGGVSVEPVTLPAGFGLQAVPNPFNPGTSLRFVLEHSQQVELAVYDLQGRLVARLVQGPLAAGSHQVRFEAAGLASGLYMALLSGEGWAESRKLVLLK